MKKRRILVYVMMAAMVMVLSFCSGGKGESVKTEPEKPVKQSPQVANTSEEKELPAQNPETPVIMAPAEMPLERPQELEVSEINNDKLPVISPDSSTPRQVEQTGEVLKTEDIPDSISEGMMTIFRSYGYDGAIVLPENFKRRVAYYIRYFSENEKGVRFFRRAMERSNQFLPMIRDILAKKQLPLSLAYLPLIESGYNPNAYSRAKALGMWQFMKGTALMYGLKVTRKLDQRRDPIQSTIAAAEYLNDLLAMFGAQDPFLGICAYNAGEGKILRALRTISYTERSFWTLVKKGILHNETNEYIPRLLAVTLMASEPDKYLAASRNVPLEMKPEEVETEDQEIINSMDSSKDDLLAGVNGEVKDSVTAQESLVEQSEPVQTTTPTITEPTGTNRYKVTRGDTLYNISQRFNTTVSQLKKWNNLKSNRIHLGQNLKISDSGSAQTSKIEKNQPKKGTGKSKVIYTVNYADSLVRIALFFDGVSARDIMNWNHMRHSRIFPKQKLVIYLQEHPKKIKVHVVRRGDTARSIAKKYGVRIELVLSLNSLLTNSKIKPGQRLKIYLL